VGPPEGDGRRCLAPQLKKLDQAVSAAHTFFVANPQHLQMREDIEKYRRMSGVKSDSFRDLEATPHWVRVRGRAGRQQLVPHLGSWSVPTPGPQLETGPPYVES